MSKFPVILPGDEITAALLTSMLTAFEYKINNTDRASTTTYADDPDLTTTLDANSTYFAIFFLKPAAQGTGNMKTNWTVPTGATGSRACIGPASALTTDQGDGRWGAHGFTTDVVYGHRSNNTFLCAALEYAVVTTTNAGTLALAWAQNASSANSTRMGNGSTLFVYKLA